MTGQRPGVRAVRVMAQLAGALPALCCPGSRGLYPSIHLSIYSIYPSGLGPGAWGRERAIVVQTVKCGHKSRPSTGAPAPLWRRLAALVYDTLILAALMLVTAAVYHALVNNVLYGRTEAVAGFNPGLAILVSVVVYCFFSLCWRRSGQTLGMQSWHLRLQSLEGKAPSRWQCLARLLVAIPALALGGMGLWWMLIDKQGKTWQDHLSRTQILYQPPRRS